MLIEHLESFLAVARHLNFTKAAKSMFASQSTLSRNISELENSLGVKLFFRNNRFVRLTPAGEALLKAAPGLLQEIHAVERRVQASDKERFSVLNVAVPRFYEDRVFNAFNEYVNKYSYKGLRLSSYIRGSVHEAINNPLCDIIFAYSFEFDDLSGEFNTRKLFDDNFVLLVSKSHPLAFRGRVLPEDLHGHHLMLLDHHSDDAHKEISSIFYENGVIITYLTEGIAEETPDIDSLMIQIRAGTVIAFVPRWFASTNISGCETVELEGVDSSYSVTVNWRKSDSYSEQLSFFLDRLFAAFPEEKDTKEE